MKHIIISGIDGSGKTTIIDSLINELKKGGYNVKYIWMRYNHYLVKILNAYARIVGLSVKVKYGENVVWEHRYYQSKTFFKLYIIASFIDNTIASYRVKKIKKRNYDYVICDRWINDVIIDIGSEFRMLDILKSAWYARFQKILPANSIQFVVFRYEDKVVAARDDNKYDINFSARLLLYNKLDSDTNTIKIDNTNTIENSVKQIISRL